MNARELIAALEQMPPEAEVLHLWDGALRSGISHVWRTKDGRVGTGEDNEPIYYDCDRPTRAPSEKVDRYFRMADLPAVQP